ncbi:hypothetical protein [Cellulophaga sp. Hel_I_12]|uniref:hypothetical protein n=1 Tax=Cellulophaga sp. Hel_I_12 TaxID=1249972 RepID=UPI000647A38C|nr:hypothetical protein [Cellulophaga sp. Hel_I_12]
MLKTLLISGLLYLFFLPYETFCQEKQSGDYIVNIEGDTLFGKVQHLNKKNVNPKYYKKIRWTNQQGQRRKFNRKDVLAFSVDHQIFEGFWLKPSSQNGLFGTFTYTIDPKKKERYFLKTLHRGSLNHYELGWWEQGESLFLTLELFKKKEDMFLIRVDQGVLGLKRKSLIHYFQECPQLVEKIKNKVLKNSSEIVSFYTTKCDNPQ